MNNFSLSNIIRKEKFYSSFLDKYPVDKTIQLLCEFSTIDNGINRRITNEKEFNIFLDKMISNYNNYSCFSLSKILFEKNEYFIPSYIENSELKKQYRSYSLTKWFQFNNTYNTLINLVLVKDVRGACQKAIDLKLFRLALILSSDSFPSKLIEFQIEQWKGCKIIEDIRIVYTILSGNIDTIDLTKYNWSAVLAGYYHYHKESHGSIENSIKTYEMALTNRKVPAPEYLVNGNKFVDINFYLFKITYMKDTPINIINTYLAESCCYGISSRDHFISVLFSLVVNSMLSETASSSINNCLLILAEELECTGNWELSIFFLLFCIGEGKESYIFEILNRNKSTLSSKDSFLSDFIPKCLLKR